MSERTGILRPRRCGQRSARPWASFGQSCPADDRVGHRRAPGRHRVRVWRHAGQVGGRRGGDPPPRADRRRQGNLGPGAGRGGSRGDNARRSSGTRPRWSAEAMWSFSDGPTGSSTTASANGGTFPSGSGASVPMSSSGMTRGGATASIPITGMRDSSPPTPSSPPATLTSSRIRTSPPTVRRRSCCGRRTNRTTSRTSRASSRPRSPRCWRTRANSRAPWASTTAASAEVDAFALRVRTQLQEHGALVGLTEGESFHLLTDI